MPAPSPPAGAVDRTEPTTRPLAWLLTADRLDRPHLFASHLRFTEMAAALGRRGFALEVITPGRGVRSRALSALGGAIHRQHPTAPPLSDPPPGWEFSWLVAFGLPWLGRLARRQRPDWIFTNSALYAPLIRRIKRRGRQAPVVHADVMGLSSIELGDVWGGVRGWTVRRVHRHLEGVLVRAADLVTTINERHASTIAQLFSPRTFPIVLRDAAEPIDRDRLPVVDLASVGIPAGVVTLAFLGQLMHRRLDDLLGALERIPPPVRLWTVIIGDGHDRAAYERRVAASEVLRGRVLFLGYRERSEALALVGACDIAFSDCWSAAGFPFKLFEYMALGRAIVVEGKEQMRELLRDGEHCVFYRSVDDLARVIVALCQDETRRRRLGQAAHALFEAAHTLGHRRAQLDALLIRCLPFTRGPQDGCRPR